MKIKIHEKLYDSLCLFAVYMSVIAAILFFILIVKGLSNV